MAKKQYDINARMNETNDVLHNIFGPKDNTTASPAKPVAEEKKKDETYRTSLILERAAMEKMKILAFKEGKTITEVLTSMMKDYIASYEKKNGELVR